MKRVFSSRFLFRAFGMGWVIAGGAIFGISAEEPAAMPETSVSLRGVVGGSIEIGEPLRIAVRVDPPAEGAAKIVLAPAKGSWIDATTVEILSAGGGRVVATGKPAMAAAEASVVLDQEQAAHGLWWFDGESMAPLALGEYSVRARLSIRDGTGWKGASVSEPATFTVIAASNDPERVTQRVLARAHAAVLQDTPAKAAEMLDEVLKRDPDNVPILEMRAALCLHGGNPASAYVCINRARTLLVRQGGHPSGQLHAFASRIEAAMAGNTAATPAPEVWSSAPLSVFAAIRPTAAETAKRAESAPAAASETKGVPETKSAATVTAGVVVPWAELSDQKIIADANGQWAATATARTQYDQNQYSATRATGAPDVKVAGNSPDAWCPATRGEGIDWLDLTFAKPVQAVEVRVRQNDAPGAIVKIEAIESDGSAHVWWEGVDPYQRSAVREIVWFVVRVPKTSYSVSRVKVTLNLATGSGYKEIDAVQLVAAP